MRRKLLTILAVTALVFGVSAGAQQRELQSVRRTDQGVEVTLSGGDGGVLIGTAYDPAGALTGLKMLQTVPGQNQYLLPGREISRVMLWESAQTMRPLGAAQNVIPEVRAFPGAEGGGKYTKGARTADVRDVYHVTNLNASGSGSLAYGLESMKSGTGRIIVFDIGGTIDLSERTKSLRINHPNVTILGQTAPGDGITVIGTDVLIEADQVILQHLRIRPGDQGGVSEPDGLGGRWIHDVIVDHCSVSWGVDELLTLYAGSLENGQGQSENITVSNCISAESLRMSNHIKGAHGYGGIVGAANGSYFNNLFAHHDSRSPRIDRNIPATELVNNVIYDWGNNSVYGAEPYSYNNRFYTPEYASNINIRGCFYRYGPSTQLSVRYKIFEATNNGAVPDQANPAKSNFYIGGNVVWGNEAVTENNWLNESSIQNQRLMNRLTAPVDMGEYVVDGMTAEEAYEFVLDNAGATLPRRDSIDARIVADVKNISGRILNRPEEVGGFLQEPPAERAFVIDNAWKSAHGMDSSMKETAVIGEGAWAGYTWIEAYVHDTLSGSAAPKNPEIRVASPATASLDMSREKPISQRESWAVVHEGQGLLYSARGIPKAGTAVMRMTLYDGERMIGEYAGDAVQDTLYLKPGTHYLTCRAYNDRGESTTSPTSIVYVLGTDCNGWEYAQIGIPAFYKKGGGWYADGVYTISGSGTIGGSGDKCDYLYQKVTGDFVLTAGLKSFPKFENGAYAGIMLREDTSKGAKMVMMGASWLKYGANMTLLQRTKTGGSTKSQLMKLENGKAAENTSSVTYEMPRYLRMERKGDVLTVSVSDSGTDWTDNPRQPERVSISGWGDTLCLGFAADSADSVCMIPMMSQAEFDRVKLEN